MHLEIRLIHSKSMGWLAIASYGTEEAYRGEYLPTAEEALAAAKSHLKLA